MGRGITISRTFAHIFSTFMMAFGPPVNGLHPAPWRPAAGGFSFDILCQIHVPESFEEKDFFDPKGMIWWLTSLLRFRRSPFILLPVIADAPFADGPKNESITFLSVEMEHIVLRVQQEWDMHITVEDLEWIKKYWFSAGKLLKHNGFNLLFQSHCQSPFMKYRDMALIAIWGGLEAVFSPSRTEVSFRVSSNIASFLEPAGKARLDLQKHVNKLYGARSQVAHGGDNPPEAALKDTFALSKRVIQKIIEQDHVPMREDLDSLLFGS